MTLTPKKDFNSATKIPSFLRTLRDEDRTRFVIEATKYILTITGHPTSTQGWWCAHTDLMKETLTYLSEVSNKSSLWNEFRQKVGKQLSFCRQCAIKYHRAVAEWELGSEIAEWDLSVSRRRIASLLNWDAGRIIPIMDDYASYCSLRTQIKLDGRRVQCREVLLESLLNLRLCMHKPFLDSILRLGRSNIPTQTEDDLVPFFRAYGAIPPGILALCFHREYVVRNWAFRAYQRGTQSYQPPREHLDFVVKRAVKFITQENSEKTSSNPFASLNKQTLWEGLSNIICCLEKNLLERLLKRSKKIALLECTLSALKSNNYHIVKSSSEIIIHLTTKVPLPFLFDQGITMESFFNTIKHSFLDRLENHLARRHLLQLFPPFLSKVKRTCALAVARDYHERSFKLLANSIALKVNKAGNVGSPTQTNSGIKLNEKGKAEVMKTGAMVLNWFYELASPVIPVKDVSMISTFVVTAVSDDPTYEHYWHLIRTVLLSDLFSILRCLYQETDVDMITTHFMSKRSKRMELGDGERDILEQMLFTHRKSKLTFSWLPTVWNHLRSGMHISSSTNEELRKKVAKYEIKLMLDLHRILGIISARHATNMVSDDRLGEIDFCYNTGPEPLQRRKFLRNVLLQMQETVYTRIIAACKNSTEQLWWNELPYHVTHLLASERREVSGHVFLVMQRLAKTYGADVVHSHAKLMANIMHKNKEVSTMIGEGCIITIRLIFTLGASISLRTFPCFFLWYRVLLDVREDGILESNDSFKWAQGVMLTFVDNWRVWEKDTPSDVFCEVCIRFLTNVRDVWSCFFNGTSVSSDVNRNDQIRACQRRIMKGLLNMYEVANKSILPNWCQTVIAMKSTWAYVPEHKKQVLSILQSFAETRERLPLKKCKELAMCIGTPEALAILKTWTDDEARSSQPKKHTDSRITNYFNPVSSNGEAVMLRGSFNSKLFPQNRIGLPGIMQKRTGASHAFSKPDSTSRIMAELRRGHRQAKNEATRGAKSSSSDGTSTAAIQGKTKFEILREKSRAEKEEKRKQEEAAFKQARTQGVEGQTQDVLETIHNFSNQSHNQLSSDVTSLDKAFHVTKDELSYSERTVRDRSLDRVYASILSQTQTLCMTRGRTSRPEIEPRPRPLDADSYVTYWEPLLIAEFAACLWKATGEERDFAEKNVNAENNVEGCRFPFRVEGPAESIGYIQNLAINKVENQQKQANSSQRQPTKSCYDIADVQVNDVLVLDIPPSRFASSSAMSDSSTVFAIVSNVEKKRDSTRLQLKVNLELLRDAPGKDREVYVSKLMSLTTFSRQLDGLWGLGTLPDGILWPILSPVDGMARNSDASRELRRYSSNLITQDRFIQSLLRAKKLNASQADAIFRVVRSCVPLFTHCPTTERSNFRTDRGSVSLIQGPPGTGKTSTIMALLSTLLLTSRNRPKQKKIQLEDTQVIVNAPQIRVLVCAPSNAAVDELMLRMMRDGLETPRGGRVSPRMVRVGGGSTLDIIQPLELSTLCQRSTERKETPVENDRIQKLLSQMNQIKEQINAQEAERKRFTKLKSMETGGGEISATALEQFPGYKAIMQKLKSLYDQRRFVGTNLSKERERGKSADALRKREKLRKMCSILNGVPVVFATLNSAGHDLMRSLAIHFDVVIVDEAAQCSEPDILIPATVGRKPLARQRGFSHLVLVGDQNQLPATVISAEKPVSRALGVSMFERLATNVPESVQLLNTQYRMHPRISLFPSTQFYNRRLVNGPNVLQKTMHKAFHRDPSKRFGPLSFFDTTKLDAREIRSAGGSLHNPGEARLVVDVLAAFVRLYHQAPLQNEIVILSPYKQQVNHLKTMVKKYPELRDLAVEVSTIDGIQGREKSVVLISTVRSGKARDIGFVNDQRRMNVAITRAKHTLMIFGHAEILSKNSSSWSALVSHCLERSCLISTGKHPSGLCPELQKDPAQLRGETLPPDEELSDIEDENVSSRQPKRNNTVLLRSRPLTSPELSQPVTKRSLELAISDQSDQAPEKRQRIYDSNKLRSIPVDGENNQPFSNVQQQSKPNEIQDRPLKKKRSNHLEFEPSRSVHKKLQPKLQRDNTFHLGQKDSDVKNNSTRSTSSGSVAPDIPNSNKRSLYDTNRSQQNKDKTTNSRTLHRNSPNYEAWEAIRKCAERHTGNNARPPSFTSKGSAPRANSSNQPLRALSSERRVPAASNSSVFTRLGDRLDSRDAFRSQRNQVGGISKQVSKRDDVFQGKNFRDIRRGNEVRSRPTVRDAESRLLAMHRRQQQDRAQNKSETPTNQRTDRKRVTAPARGFSLAESQKDMEQTCEMLRRAKGYR